MHMQAGQTHGIWQLASGACPATFTNTATAGQRQLFPVSLKPSQFTSNCIAPLANTLSRFLASGSCPPATSTNNATAGQRQLFAVTELQGHYRGGVTGV